MKITVLMGGTSSERDVSLASGLRVAQALRVRGHDVTAVDTAAGALSQEQEDSLLRRGVATTPPSREDLARMAAETLPQMLRILPELKAADAVFVALHGGAGEDGTIQSLLDLAGVRYTGSGHLASALAMDKDLSKHLFRDHGVQTADWVMVRRSSAIEGDYEIDFLPDHEPILDAADESSPLEIIVDVLGLPLIAKPSKQGSTVGLTVVREPDQIIPAIEEALLHDDEVMLEEFVSGRELTVGILGTEALPVGEIIPKHEIYDYECKYTPGMAEEIFPAEIPDAVGEEAQDQARRAFEALKLRGYARIDFKMTEDGELYCLEANTAPGMTQTSLIPQAAVAAGIDFPLFCERVVEIALGGGAGEVSER
jgi:D-alanine-D-alanine ligase